jgi:hypothetical protein
MHLARHEIPIAEAKRSTAYKRRKDLERCYQGYEVYEITGTGQCISYPSTHKQSPSVLPTPKGF